MRDFHGDAGSGERGEQMRECNFHDTWRDFFT